MSIIRSLAGAMAAEIWCLDLDLTRSKPLDFAVIKGVASWLNRQLTAADPLPHQGTVGNQLLGREDWMLAYGYLRIQADFGFDKLLADVLHQVPQVWAEAVVIGTGGRDSAAALMAQHHQQVDVQGFQSVFDRSHAAFGVGVAGIADHEHVTKTDIKEQFNRHSGIGATQHHGDGVLAVDELMQTLLAAVGMFGDRFDKALMASLEFSKGLWCRKFGVVQRRRPVSVDCGLVLIGLE